MFFDFLQRIVKKRKQNLPKMLNQTSFILKILRDIALFMNFVSTTRKIIKDIIMIY